MTSRTSRSYKLKELQTRYTVASLILKMEYQLRRALVQSNRRTFLLSLERQIPRQIRRYMTYHRLKWIRKEDYLKFMNSTAQDLNVIPGVFPLILKRRGNIRQIAKDLKWTPTNVAGLLIRTGLLYFTICVQRLYHPSKRATLWNYATLIKLQPSRQSDIPPLENVSLKNNV